MKRLLLVVCVMLLLSGIFTAGVYAEEIPWDRNFNTYYAEWKFGGTTAYTGRLFVDYYPKTADGPYEASTILRRDLDDTNTFASVRTQTAIGTSTYSSNTTPSCLYVYSGYTYGPAYMDPVKIIHTGSQDVNDVFYYGVVVY